MALPLVLPCGFDSGYQIKQSLWFSNQSSTYAVYPTGAAADTSYTKKTFSFWFKKAKREQAVSFLFASYADDSHRGQIYFDADRIALYSTHSAYGVNCQKITTRKFKDTTNWYHCFIATDTSLATAEDRVQLWINGERITSFSTNTNPGQNQTICWNVLKATGWWVCWGRYYNPTYQFDGQLAEIHVLDNTAALVTDFGYRDAVTGQWRPKRYTKGGYGGMGGYYPWDDPTSLTTLGYDRSGTGNHLTCGGFSLTTTAWNYAPSKDTPTNNYAAMNWNDVVERNSAPTYLTYYPNNLFVQNILADMWRCSVSTLSASRGKWYFEATLWCVGSIGDVAGVGIAPASFDVVGHPVFVGGQIYYGVTADSYGWYTAGYKLNNGAATAWGTTWSPGSSDTVRVAVDLDNGKIWFGDRTYGWWGSGNPETGANPAFTIPTGVEYRFGAMCYARSGFTNYGQAALNFGAQPFAGTQPAGYKTLCAKNLPNPTVMNPHLYFDMDIYSGNGTTRSRTGFKFQPGFAGFKARNYNGIHHGIVDRVRGVDKIIYPSGAIAEGTDATGVTSFNSDGYSLGACATMNANGYNYVSWLFRDPGAAVTNTDGSITAQVSADQQRGYSIISYQGNGSAGATVGHGLGKVPALMFVKYRANYSWVNYHKDMNASPATGYMDWDNTNNFTSASVIWNNTAPTSSVFTIGTNLAVNTNTGWHIAYCFAEIPGFMAMGSYYGKGQHNFQHCGFTPRFIMIKCCYGYYAGNWVWIDTKRDDVPPIESALYFNSYGVEGTLYNGGVYVTSNGFDIADYVNTDFDNYDGSYGYGRAKYVWWAIADMPMKYSNAR